MIPAHSLHSVLTDLNETLGIKSVEQEIVVPSSKIGLMVAGQPLTQAQRLVRRTRRPCTSPATKAHHVNEMFSNKLTLPARRYIAVREQVGKQFLVSAAVLRVGVS